MKVELTEPQIRACCSALGFALAGEPGEPPIETSATIKAMENAHRKLNDALAAPNIEEVDDE